MDLTEALMRAIRTLGFAQRAAGDEWVRGSGLTRQQAFTLGYLEAHQDREVIARELAEISRTTPASVTSLLQGLEDRGYIVRTPSPEDSRAKLVSITPDGARLIAGFDQEMRTAQERLFDPLTADEQRQLLILLRRIIDDNDLPEAPVAPQRGGGRGPDPQGGDTRRRPPGRRSRSSRREVPGEPSR